MGEIPLPADFPQSPTGIELRVPRSYEETVYTAKSALSDMGDQLPRRFLGEGATYEDGTGITSILETTENDKPFIIVRFDGRFQGFPDKFHTLLVTTYRVQEGLQRRASEMVNEGMIVGSTSAAQHDIYLITGVLTRRNAREIFLS